MSRPAASSRVSTYPHSDANRFLRPVRGLAPLLLALLTVLYFWSQVVEGQALYWGDIGLYFAPMTGFLRDNLLRGRLPLWNPLIDCGTPFFGNPQTWPLYPTTALLPLVSASYFLSLTVALHVWLAGMGTYRFARRVLEVRRVPALLAAIVFMFGGQLVSKEQFPNMVAAMAWLPWTLWATDRLLRRGRVRDSLLLGVVFGLQLLAAHPQMALLTVYLAAAWGIWVCRAHPDWSRRGVRLLLLAAPVAAGLAAGQLLPTLALFWDAARQHLAFSVVNRFYLPLGQTANFLLPTLHGHPYNGTWTARGNFWETCSYIGVLPFGLAVWGGIRAWHRTGRDKPGRGAARFWCGAFLVGLWMAWGGAGGLYHLAFWILPGFRAFHDPARCLLWSCFALSMLAAGGLESLMRRWAGRVMFGETVVLLAFLDLAFFGQTLYPLASPHVLSPVSPNVARVQSDPDVAAAQARVLAPTEGVWLRFTNPKAYRQDVPGYHALWADTLTPNLTMPYGLQNAYGYEPVALKNAQFAGSRAETAWESAAPIRARDSAALLAGTLGVKYIALCLPRPPQAVFPGLQLVRAAPTLPPPGPKPAAADAQDKVYLFRNLRWSPRARLYEGFAPVTLAEDGPDRVRLTVTTLRAAHVVLADTRAAGWTATLDGRPAAIDAAGASLRIVDVPTAGAHTLTFSYRPTPFRLGLYLSLLTLGGLSGAAGFRAAKFARRFFRRQEGIRVRQEE